MTQESGREIKVAKSHSKRGVMVVTVCGEVDEQGGDELVAAITRQAKVGRRLFVLDLSDAGPLSPKALAELRGVLTRLEDQGCEFTIAGAKGDTFQAIETIGLHRVAPCYPDVTAATSAF